MNKLFEFFAKRHIFATLFTVMIILLGLNSLRTLRRDQFPNVDMGQMIIETVYPGAAPEDVELNVTNKLEDQLKNVTGIKQITSTSLENVSVITITIDTDVDDPEQVKTDIREAVGRVTDFPEEVTESPSILDIKTSIIPIIEVGISGELPYEEMREIAKQFEKKLKNVPGVSHLARYGYRAKEVKVQVVPSAMDRFQIPLREIIGAVQARNIRMAGGTFESFTSEKNVVTLAQFKKPTDVGNVIIRSTFEGPLIRVRDLAIVEEDFEDEVIISHMEGKKAISFLVFKNEHADIIRTSKAIKKLIKKESTRYIFAPEKEPEGADRVRYQINRFVKRYLRGEKEPVTKVYWLKYGNVRIMYSDDRAPYVQNSFQIVLKNLAIGLVLVLLMLSIFLNLRTAFWVAVGIPVAILGTFFFLPLFDSFLDSISLLALILVIGIIVDDGIIISENIARRREMGDPPLKAASEGVREVFLPVLTTVLTTFLGFAPMLFMKGMMGKFIYVIPLVVSLALFISLFESVFALPAHLKRGMEKLAARKAAREGTKAEKKGKDDTKAEKAAARSERKEARMVSQAEREAVRKWFARLREFYKKLCYYFLKARYILVVLFFAILAATIFYAMNNMEFLLFPTKGADRFYIGIELPTGTSLLATEEKVKEIEALIQDLPKEELKTFITRVGTLGWVGTGENYAYVLIGLTPYSERTRTVNEIIEELRFKANKIDGIDKIVFEIDTGGPPVGKPISLQVIGSDDEMRTKLANRIEDFLMNTEGVKDIDRNDKLGKQQVEIRFSYSRLARLGLTVADVAQNVRIAYDGQIVTSMRDGDEDIKFRVLLSEKARRNVNFLTRLSIPNRQGRLIKLGEVASLKTSPGLNAYHHFDGERAVTIQADLDQDVTTPLLVTQALMEQLDMDNDWPGMRINIGGEAEESRKAMFNLILSFIVAAVGIYFLLVLLFNSFSQPVLVLVAIPFGIVGVIIALALHKEPLSFLAMTGMIGLAGVVVNDSLVLVSHLNKLRKERPVGNLKKHELREHKLRLVAEGTSDRLRAIILTTLTTVAGLLPLAYGLGGESLYMSPMALALGYGLIFATPLTLVLVPCMYAIGWDLKRAVSRNKDYETE
jgi:multidrug efflux pump subunit AcrB